MDGSVMGFEDALRDSKDNGSCSASAKPIDIKVDSLTVEGHV
jgi:hypothetical protein